MRRRTGYQCGLRQENRRVGDWQRLSGRRVLTTPLGPKGAAAGLVTSTERRGRFALPISFDPINEPLPVLKDRSDHLIIKRVANILNDLARTFSRSPMALNWSTDTGPPK